MLYRHEATFSGRFAFPIDMLRYDCCFPASQEAAGRIVENLAGRADLDGYTVRVAQFTDKKAEPRWTVDPAARRARQTGARVASRRSLRREGRLGPVLHNSQRRVADRGRRLPHC